MSSLAPHDGRSSILSRLAPGTLVLLALAGYYAGAAPPLGAPRTAVAAETLSDERMDRFQIRLGPRDIGPRVEEGRAGPEGLGPEASERGTGEVPSPVARVEPAAGPAPEPGAAFFVQLAAFARAANAERAWELLRREHGEILGALERTIEGAATDHELLVHRVLVGPFASRAAAAEVCRALQQRQQDCFLRGPA